jgi:HSP20 family molecular chaperone IbpA
VDHNAIRARLQDGVLQLTLPIADPAEAQTIEIEE